MYIIIYTGQTEQLCAEGPWSSRAEADAFMRAEVSKPARIHECTDFVQARADDGEGFELYAYGLDEQHARARLVELFDGIDPGYGEAFVNANPDFFTYTRVTKFDAMEG